MDECWDLVVLVDGNGGSRDGSLFLAEEFMVSLALAVWAVGTCGFMMIFSKSWVVLGTAKLYFSLLSIDLGIVTLQCFDISVVHRYLELLWNAT